MAAPSRRACSSRRSRRASPSASPGPSRRGARRGPRAWTRAAAAGRGPRRPTEGSQAMFAGRGTPAARAAWTPTCRWPPPLSLSGTPTTDGDATRVRGQRLTRFLGASVFTVAGGAAAPVMDVSRAAIASEHAGTAGQLQLNKLSHDCKPKIMLRFLLHPGESCAAPSPEASHHPLKRRHHGRRQRAEVRRGAAKEPQG